MRRTQLVEVEGRRVLLLLIALGYFNNPAGQAHFSKKVTRWLTQRPAILRALFTNPRQLTVDGQPTVAVNIDGARFNRSIDHICRALHFHTTRDAGLDRFTFTRSMLPAMEHANADAFNEAMMKLCNAALLHLENAKAERLGENPDVFWCQSFVDPRKKILVYHLVFFEGFHVFGVSHPELRGWRRSIRRLLARVKGR